MGAMTARRRCHIRVVAAQGGQDGKYAPNFVPWTEDELTMLDEPYDCTSIMHYREFEYAIGESSPGNKVIAAQRVGVSPMLAVHCPSAGAAAV